MMLSRRALLGAAAALPMARLAAGATAHRLTILHMNDFHARHEPVDGRALACRPNATDCYGGAARLATALLRERQAAEAAGRTVLLVDAGDQFQGSLFYTAWHGEVELTVMHVLGTEAMAVGNHEFDNGPATLAHFVRGAKFPVLSANIDASADPDLAGLLRPHAIIQKGPIRIGLAGATTLETRTGSSPGPTIRFTDPNAALAAATAELRAAGANLVVALSHLGIAEDTALAGTIPGLDIIVGGHSHTLLSDSEPGAAGPAHAAIRGTVVVQAACYGRYIGRLDIDLANDFTPVAFGGDVRHVGLDLPQHPEVAAIVARYAAQLDTVRRRVIGHAPAAIGNETCRIEECGLGSLIADAMRASVQGADIAIMNAGGIRTGLPAGDVTLGDILGMLPFGNTIATLQLTGADLQAALRIGLARPGAGAFPQIAGARLTWTAATQTLVSVDLRNPDGTYTPLDPARRYTVVTNNFLRAGGDGYSPFRDRAIDAYDAGPGLDETVANALAAHPAISAAPDGRLAIK
jgi:5'-nucleotidase